MIPPLLEGEVDKRRDRAVVIRELVGDVKAVHARMPDRCEYINGMLQRRRLRTHKHDQMLRVRIRLRV